MRIDIEALFAALGIQLFSSTLLTPLQGIISAVFNHFLQVPLPMLLFWGTCVNILVSTGIAGAGVAYYARRSALRTSLAFAISAAGVWGFYWIVRYGFQQVLIFLLLLMISSLVGTFLMSKKK